MRRLVCTLCFRRTTRSERRSPESSLQKNRLLFLGRALIPGILRKMKYCSRSTRACCKNHMKARSFQAIYLRFHSLLKDLCRSPPKKRRVKEPISRTQGAIFFFMLHLFIYDYITALRGCQDIILIMLPDIQTRKIPRQALHSRLSANKKAGVLPALLFGGALVT